MKKIILISLLVLGTFSVEAQTVQMDAEKRAEYRECIGLDYSMPDYSTSRVNPKVMGARLAKILDKILDMSKVEGNLSRLAVMQARQIDGMQYCIIKKIQLKEVTKCGNEITIVFNTTLEPNAKHIKKALLTFKFDDGVSDDVAANDYFCSLCRYIKE